MICCGCRSPIKKNKTIRSDLERSPHLKANQRVRREEEKMDLSIINLEA